MTLTKDDLKEVRTIVREEIVLESEKSKSDTIFSSIDFRRELRRLTDEIKDMEIKIMKLTKLTKGEDSE